MDYYEDQDDQLGELGSYFSDRLKEKKEEEEARAKEKLEAEKARLKESTDLKKKAQEELARGKAKLKEIEDAEKDRLKAKVDAELDRVEKNAVDAIFGEAAEEVGKGSGQSVNEAKKDPALTRRMVNVIAAMLAAYRDDPAARKRFRAKFTSNQRSKMDAWLLLNPSENARARTPRQNKRLRMDEARIKKAIVALIRNFKKSPAAYEKWKIQQYRLAIRYQQKGKFADVTRIQLIVREIESAVRSPLDPVAYGKAKARQIVIESLSQEDLVKLAIRVKRMQERERRKAAGGGGGGLLLGLVGVAGAVMLLS